MRGGEGGKESERGGVRGGELEEECEGSGYTGGQRYSCMETALPSRDSLPIPRGSDSPHEWICFFIRQGCV